MGPGDGTSSEHLRFAPRAKHVLEVARGLTRSDVTPEVLLVALVREGGVAIRILTELDAPPERVEDVLGTFFEVHILASKPRPAMLPVLMWPEHRVSGLLMKAAARALDDGRVESRIGDLLAALAGDATAAAWLAARGVDVAGMRAVIDRRVTAAGRIHSADGAERGVEDG